MKIAVLGSGPTGLLAAHAITVSGFDDVTVFAKGHKSTLYGAQYLHKAIPESDCGPPHRIKVMLDGTADEYRRKVYGQFYNGPVSPAHLESGHFGWDIRRMYDHLWEVYGGPKVYQLHVDIYNIRDVYAWINDAYDIVFTSIPMRPLCHDPENIGAVNLHIWNSQEVFAIGDAPELQQLCPIRPGADFTIQYNGARHTGWYRSAMIFGHATCEWPATNGRRKPPLTNVARVHKPISTDCTCWPNWIRIGRYGEFKKGILVHEAFEKVQSILAGGTQSALF